MSRNKRKKRPRIGVPTFDRPHGRERCSKCDGVREAVARHPQDFDIARLVELRKAIAEASPPFGVMVKARVPGLDLEVWACPRHAPIERVIDGKTSHWRLVEQTA